MQKNKIIVKNVHMEYKERRKAPREQKASEFAPGDTVVVLNDVNFTICDGEFVCILGPSGCGKSTLLKIIAGFQKPTHGEVSIDGDFVNCPKANSIFVFQEGGLFPWLTVYENIALGLHDVKDDKRKSEIIEEYLDMVGLVGFEDHYPHMLSGGMKQRAEIARALVTQPKVLYMDEPFSGLDFLTRLRLREELINMHLYFHKTTLFVTHDIDEAIQLADRLIVLTDRPSVVKVNYEIRENHPRDLSRGELSKLRQQLYFSLGVHYTL